MEYWTYYVKGTTMTQPKTISRSISQPRTLAHTLARRWTRACAWCLVIVLLAQFVSPTALAAGNGGRSKLAATPPARRSPQGPPPYVVFGPEPYEVVFKDVANYESSFDLPADAAAPFVIHVVNGNPNGTERVKHGVVSLAGTGRPVVVADFDDTVGEVVEPIDLDASNMLLIDLEGPDAAPGGHVTITVEGLQASLSSIDVTSATQNSMATVTLHGTNTTWSVGDTTASFGSGISVGGAPEGELGPVTVIDETTATASITVGRPAALGQRTVTAHVQGGETVTLANGFTVRPTPAFSPSTMSVGTLAGTVGTAGFADGAAATAKFNGIAAVTVGSDGAIYVADSGNNRIRVVREEQSGWMVSTLAGDGTAGYQDGAGATARFDHPKGVAVDASGNVYVADTNNHRIRKVAPNGVVTTVAGTGVAGSTNGAPLSSQFNQPQSLAYVSGGGLYIADVGNQRLRVWDFASDSVATATKGTIDVAGVAQDDGRLYVYMTDGATSAVLAVNEEERGPVQATEILGNGYGFLGYPEPRFADPSGLAMEGEKVLVADSTNSLIRRFDPDQLAFQMQQMETLAGSGERGYADGRGDLAKFDTPRSVAATSWGTIVVADAGNHVLREVVRRPTVTSITPGSGHAGDTVTIAGTYFDSRGPAYNAVRFAKAGGGTVAATVTSATQTELAVVVPAGAVTGAVTVETQGGAAEGSFTVLVSAPVITGFTPTHGPVGTLVTLTGTDFGQLQAVTFAGASRRLVAGIVSAGSNQIQVLVPNGAVTGRIQVKTALGLAETDQDFVVEASQTFELTITPESQTAVQATTTKLVVYANSPDPLFNHIVSLSIDPVAGITGTFDPPSITAGAFSTLSLRLAGSLATGSYGITVRGRATVDGVEYEQQTTATITVVAAGQTTLVGRVLSTDDLPVIGATVSIYDDMATTDGSGSFLLREIPAGVDLPLMIAPNPLATPGRTYPTIVEPVTVIEDVANQLPYNFYLPPIDTEHEVPVTTGTQAVVKNPMIPGLQLTIPAGANLQMPGGNTVSQVSLTAVPIDRTPAPLPPDVETSLVFSAQPGGAVSSVPMPIVFPNTSGLDVGEAVKLYTFNHILVRWEIYGTGHVIYDEEEGTSRIAPDINPATGQPYGLTTFSWHFAARLNPRFGNPGGGGGCPCSTTSHPVNLATGFKVESATDIAIGGARGGLVLNRVFTSNLAENRVIGQFGLGWRTNYDYAIVEVQPPPTTSGGNTIPKAGRLEAERMGVANLASKTLAGANNMSWRVISPSDGGGRLFNFVTTEANDTIEVYKTTATLTQLGDELRRFSDGQFEYRNRDGSKMKFDAQRRLTELVDRNGNTTTLMYDGSSRLIKVMDPVGREMTFTRNSNGTIATATDPAGRQWVYTYEIQGSIALLTGVESPDDETMHYGWDSNYRLTSMIDKRGHVTKQLEYTAAGQVSKQTFADGGWEEYTYEFSGQTITSAEVRDSLGRTRSMRFNPDGYVIEETDELGQTMKIERDEKNRPAKTIGPCGCGEATRTFDDDGNVLTITDRLQHTTQFEYDPVFNLVTETTDRNGHTTTLEYDSHGKLKRVTNALNEVTRFVYDNKDPNDLTPDGPGLLTSIFDGLNHEWKLEYDAFGNVTATIDPLGNHTEMEYDSTTHRDRLGWPTAVEDALGRRRTVVYDSLGRVTESRDTANTLTRLQYDENGNVETMTDALGKVWMRTYDNKDRLSMTEDPLGRQTHFTYDTDDEILTTISPSGRTIKVTYDARGDVATMTDPLNGEVSYQYDAYGELISFTDHRGNVTTNVYDELHRPISMRDPVGQVSSMSYDSVGNIIGTVDRLGRSTTITPDALNRPLTVAYTDATVSYDYDAAGRLEGITDTQSGTIAWNYDAASRIQTETTPNGVITYSYNTANQLDTMTASIGGLSRTPVFYDYDMAGRLHTIEQGIEVFTYAYDGLSRLESLKRALIVNEVEEVIAKTDYEYDLVHRLKRILHQNAANDTIEDLKYAYTLDDEIATISSIDGTPLAPNAANASQANAANRIWQFGDALYDFDSEGQTVTRSEAATVTNLTWDARGRLASATLSSGATVDYTYDAVGRRASRTVGSETVNFLYDGPDVVVDHSSNGNDVDYLNGPGIDKKLRQVGATGSAMYFLQDHLGSTIALTDVTGNVVDQQNYASFGGSSGSSLTRYGFAGRERDEATGLIYNRARWLDPSQGRFLREDPIGFAGGSNFYVYGDNNPINKNDPSGLQVPDIYYPPHHPEPELPLPSQFFRPGPMWMNGTIPQQTRVIGALIRVLQTPGVRSWWLNNCNNNPSPTGMPSDLLEVFQHVGLNFWNGEGSVPDYMSNLNGHRFRVKDVHAQTVNNDRGYSGDAPNQMPQIVINSRMLNTLSDEDIAHILLHEAFHARGFHARSNPWYYLGLFSDDLWNVFSSWEINRGTCRVGW